MGHQNRGAAVSRLRPLVAAPGDASPAAAARALLSDYASLYKLSVVDVGSAPIASVHDSGAGPVIVKFASRVGKVEIFREEMSVVLDRNRQGVAISGYITSPAAAEARRGAMAFRLPVHQIVAGATNDAARTAVGAAQVIDAGHAGGYDYFLLTPSAGVALDAPLRAKPVYFHTPDGLEAAYYVEVMAQSGDPEPHLLSNDGRIIRPSDGYGYVISAQNGAILFRKNLTEDREAERTASATASTPGGFTYRVWADPATGIPYDSPAGNAVQPKVNLIPDGASCSCPCRTSGSPTSPSAAAPPTPGSRSPPPRPSATTSTPG